MAAIIRPSQENGLTEDRTLAGALTTTKIRHGTDSLRICICVRIRMPLEDDLAELRPVMRSRREPPIIQTVDLAKRAATTAALC